MTRWQTVRRGTEQAIMAYVEDDDDGDDDIFKYIFHGYGI
jgi:hypothetical protein